VGLKLNGTHQLLVNADDVNLLGDNIDTMKNNIETSIDASKEVGLGRAVAQRLDDDFPPRRPGFAYGQHVGFVVDKTALGLVFSEYFGFPYQSFHRFLHYHNHPGLTQ
jgi:hypothetical protein